MPTRPMNPAAGVLFAKPGLPLGALVSLTAQRVNRSIAGRWLVDRDLLARTGIDKRDHGGTHDPFARCWSCQPPAAV